MSLLDKLVTCGGQAHLLAKDRAALEKQLKDLDRDTAGGLLDYLERARALLERCRSNTNPYEGCQVSVPEGEKFDPEADLEKFMEYERIGASEVSGLCFCLVAGGLGERLGYGDIKISLPVDTVSNKCYMQWYAEWILALEKHGKAVLPLAIMTSEDTHARTIKLFEQHDFFGLKREQVAFMKQAKVPALIDNEARMAVEETGEILTKPHGHGDVHTLLLQHGLAHKWLKEEGRRWLLFFQDTNALSWRSLLVMLGVAIRRNFAMTSLAVPRLPGEATGAIVKLSSPLGYSTTSSIEYNVLSSLVEDVAHAGFSKFPGNTNTLLLALKPYVDVLEKSRGVVPEFVNPKYIDPVTKTKFKTPTRLECLMQDFSFLLSAHGHDCGFASLPKYAAFSVVKNSNAEAVSKLKSNLPPDCAFSGEVEFFDSNRRLLALAAKISSKPLTGISDFSLETHDGVTLPVGPRIHLSPSFGLTLDEIARSISLLPDTELRLSLDEAILLTHPGEIQRRKFVIDEQTSDSDVPLPFRIRGFRIRFLV